MKNKLLFIFLILIAVNLHPTSYSYGLDENTKNGVLSKAIIACDDPHIRECGPDHNGNNVYPTMTDIYYSTLPKKKPPLDVITTIPDEFDWKNINGKDFTTPARNQGNVGTCWLFAALAILESNIEIRENCSILNPDLSEQYVLSCINGAGGVNGGSAHLAFEKILSTSPDGNNCNGIIPESCFPYQANDRIPCSEKCENWRDYLIPLSDTGYWMFEGKKEEIEEMKTWILAYGPITSAMHVDDDFKSWGATHHHPEDVFTSNKGLVANDHLVAIVGWKDNPTMKKGGYWICKNSWGMDFGYDGFFNIEYNSLGIDSGETSWVDYTPDDYNWPPVPMLASLYKGRAGEEILFDASESADPEGSIVRYDWDFGDGKSGSGMSPTHTYESQGVYTVTLAVYDNEGQLGITTSLARIQDDTNNKPSTPIIDGPSSGRKNVACLYTISASDPDGNDILFYVDWGDDQTTGWIESSSEDQVYLTHKWSTIGTYEIAVKAMDEFGAESDWGTHAVHIPKTRLMDQLYRFFNNHVNLFSFLSYIIDHTHA